MYMQTKLKSHHSVALFQVILYLHPERDAVLYSRLRTLIIPGYQIIYPQTDRLVEELSSTMTSVISKLIAKDERR